jgi:hypothetical protein
MRTVAAFGMGVVFALMVFVGSGRATDTHGLFFDSDFDAFDAADELAARGEDPYELEAIDSELASGGERYNEDFVTYPDTQSRLYFNPPLWLTMLTLVGFSSNALVVGGAFATGAALAVVHRGQPLPLLVIPSVFFLWDRIFLWANAGFGQTGYLVSAAMLWSLIAVRSSTPQSSPLAGLAASLLSPKPHLWLAHLIGLASDKRTTRSFNSPAGWQFGFSVLLGLASIAHLGPTLWASYIESLTGAELATPTLQSLTFTALAGFMTSRIAILATLAVVAGVLVKLTRSSWMGFEAKWILIVGLMMMASTHAFWHDWAWMLGVPLLLRWRIGPALGFYIAMPLASVVSNSGPAWVALSTFGVVVWSEWNAQTAETVSTDEQPQVASIRVIQPSASGSRHQS